jgi:lipoprotein signal peptidase
MTDTVAGEAQPVVSASERSEGEWPLRPWLLAALFGFAGLLIHVITHENDDVAWRVALAAFVFFGAIAAGFTLEQGRWKPPSLFALAVGAVMAGLAWRAVQYGESLPDEQYGFAAGVVASALALPLFQAGFHRRRMATPYREIFGHVWTDAISAAGALAFTGISWVVLALMSELFHLLRIDFLRDLMDEGWFGWTFSGLAAGAALGTLRNQIKVIATLQTVVLLVGSLLAVPLAFGLTVFLGATVVSGPQVLWDATRSATPLLLACAAGSFVLVNAIARQDDEAMTRSRVMRGAALVLAAVILPLAVFAAVSMGQRLSQYGLAPERLWALVAIVVACVCGVAYWVALVRGRKGGWVGYLRAATFHLGLFVCALAVLLALPILDFGAISTRNQVARLESGKVAPDQFDFAALRWDFGESGRRALTRLSRSDDANVVRLAQAALKQKERAYATFDRTRQTRADFNLRMQPDDPELRELVLDYLITQPYRCEERCVAVDIGESAAGHRRIALVQSNSVITLILRPEFGLQDEPYGAPAELGPNSRVEVSEARVIRIDGKAVGPILDKATIDAD